MIKYLYPVLIVATLALLTLSCGTPQAPSSQPATSQPTLAGAPTVKAPPADSGVQGAWAKLKAAAKGHRYREVVALVMTMVIFLWRRFGYGFVMHRLSSWQVGFVTVLVGFLGTLPTALTAPEFSWGSFIWDALVSSGEAMLLWQMVLKRIPGFKPGEAKPSAETPATPEEPKVAEPGAHP